MEFWNLFQEQKLKEREKQLRVYLKNVGYLSLRTKDNLKVVNFLDMELDITNGTYRPYRKHTDNPTYININSNNPPNI